MVETAPNDEALPSAGDFGGQGGADGGMLEREAGVEQPGVQPRTNGRGLFTADEKGEFWFRTIVPSYYPIPTDGPVGELLVATGRHAFRPAHIHFIVTAQGHRDLTTHIFVAGSEYIESDTVFAVKKSLVVDFEEVTDEELAGRWGVQVPFRHADFEIVMQPGS